MRLRTALGVVAFLLTGLSAGCGTDGGGQDGATEEQMRDPAWVNAQLKALDKEALISKTPRAPK